jgi:hypothetical protein
MTSLMSKGLFYIEIEHYKGVDTMKIFKAAGKLLETHHLMYSGLMSWRLGKGIWKMTFVTDQIHEVSTVVVFH